MSSMRPMRISKALRVVYRLSKQSRDSSRILSTLRIDASSDTFSRMEEIMRSRLVVLTLTLYLAFAVIGCTSKPPASSGNDMNNQQSADNAGAGGTTTSPGPAANTAPATAPAPEVKAPEPVKPAVVPAGTALTVRLGETLSSKTSQDGQSFTGTLVNPVEAGGATVIPAGSSVSGTVVSAKSAGRFKGESLLTLRLDTITVKGTQRTIQTSTVSSGQKGKGKRTATMIGGGAGAGALIGGIAGGGKGAAIGALVGGGAGTAGAGLTGNRDVSFGAESAVTFKLSAPLEIPR